MPVKRVLLGEQENAAPVGAALSYERGLEAHAGGDLDGSIASGRLLRRPGKIAERRG
jgi:hypothetical protein